jgi:hypothetical protein
MRAPTSQGNVDDRYGKKGDQSQSMDKGAQQVAKKSGSAAEAIERPIK